MTNTTEELVQRIADDLYICPGCGADIKADNNGCNDCGYEGDGRGDRGFKIVSVGEFMRGPSYPESGALIMNDVSPAYIRKLADALRPALAASDAGAVAYKHTLHMESGQTYSEYSESSDPTAVHGVRGTNYDQSYRVTVEPLYDRPASSACAKPAEAVAVLRREIGESTWFDHYPVAPGSKTHLALKKSGEMDYCEVYLHPAPAAPAVPTAEQSIDWEKLYNDMAARFADATTAIAGLHLQLATSAPAVPDEVRVALDEIHADMDYLFGRVIAKPDDAGFLAAAVRGKIDRIKDAMLAAAPASPAATGWVPDGYRLVPTPEKLRELLVVGAQVKVGEKYAEVSHFKAGEVLTLVEGSFDDDNGLFAIVDFAPAVWDEGAKEFDSIYHLFANDLSGFMDCEVLPPAPGVIAKGVE